MNFKRIRPNLLMRFRKGFKYGFNTFLIIFTIATGVIGVLAITGEVFTIRFILIVGAMMIFISLFVTFIKGQLIHLPDQIIFEDNIDKEYVADFCTSRTLAQANSITKPYYGSEYVSNDKAEGWRQKSPHSFIHILNNNGKLVASFGIIAIEPSFFSQFLKGRLIDNKLEPDDILDDSRTKNSNDLYISGVVVRNPDNRIGNRRAIVMVWSMLMYLKQNFGLRKEREIYALAVSQSSENLLKRSGFSIISEASERKDSLNLYHLHFTRENYEYILDRIGDYSKFCKVNF